MVNRKIRRSQSEYYNSFIEQLEFLKNAAYLYDKGNRSAIKMATPSLRTLFYKQRYGDILINLIPEINKDQFLTTCQFSDKTIVFGGSVINAFVNGKYIYLPLCYDDEANEAHFISFEHWWKGRILVSPDTSFTREDLVRFVANKDGGTHVDPELEETYYNLKNNLYSMQISYPNMPNIPFKELHLALLRQLVYEALASFKRMNFIKTCDSGKNCYNARNNIFPLQITQMTISEGKNAIPNIYY